MQRPRPATMVAIAISAAVALAVIVPHRRARDDGGRGMADLAERSLREGDRAEVMGAASVYRVKHDDAAALRLVVDAYARVGAVDEACAVGWELARRGDATAADRRRALRQGRGCAGCGDGCYADGLAWLDALLAAEPWCETFGLRVTWTAGHAEHADALARALAGCPRDDDRRPWLAERARGADAVPGDACQAVVYGEVDLARACLEEVEVAPLGQVAAARLVLGIEPIANGRIAVGAADATAFVLLAFARTPGAPHDEACAAVARAEVGERRWLPGGGDDGAIAARYLTLRRELGCGG
ncbi:MAG: hypothetical protein IPL61_23780 [Myxococcales bacterium]|nr:hypothetical protein [Myxococcales bacterium]